MNTMGIWLSFDGTYVIFSDPNSSLVGGAPDGTIAAYMLTIGGYTLQKIVPSPLPNACFGAAIAVSRGLDKMFVTAPNTANVAGNTGRVYSMS